jgi:hypothetical protein
MLVSSYEQEKKTEAINSNGRYQMTILHPSSLPQKQQYLQIAALFGACCSVKFSEVKLP